MSIRGGQGDGRFEFVVLFMHASVEAAAHEGREASYEADAQDSAVS